MDLSFQLGSPIKSVGTFIVYSNLVISVSATVPILLACYLLGFPVVYPLLLIAFSETLFIYTLNRFSDIHEDTINLPERVEFIRRYGAFLLLISGILFLYSLVWVIFQSLAAGIIAFLPVGIAFFYSFFRLKRLFLMKNVLISIGWSCSIFTVGAYFHEFAILLYVLAGLIFGAVLVISIIFDIKDRNGDTVCNIRTIPVLYGFRTAKISCLIIIAPLVLVVFYLATRYTQFVILLPFAAYFTGYILFLTDSERIPWWYFDREYIFLLGLILIIFITGIFQLFCTIHI